MGYAMVYDGDGKRTWRWCPTEIREAGQPARVCRLGEGHPQPCEMVRADGVGETAIRVATKETKP